MSLCLCGLCSSEVSCSLPCRLLIFGGVCGRGRVCECFSFITVPLCWSCSLSDCNVKRLVVILDNHLIAQEA